MTLSPSKALRTVFGEVMSDLARRDPRVVMLDADVGSSTGGETFERDHPERYLQLGIAEQNMLGVAAGLATIGFTPVASAFACFVVGRAFDSIRVLIAQPGLNVKIVGGYSGLLTGMTGKTHQIFNDIAIMRSLPNMTVLAPADEIEGQQALEAMVNTPGPCYMQVTREPAAALFDTGYAFRLGNAVKVRDGSDVTLVSSGVQTTRVYEAAEHLSRRGIESTLLHVPTIKPLDAKAVINAAQATDLVVVVEEQSVVGGLGGAVAEVLSSHYPVTVKRLGIQDVYGESGPNAALLEKYRLSAAQVANDVERLVRARAHARPSSLAPLADGATQHG